ncbi:hypothetical protein H0X48_04795, partial [Candidatus Dependentiae bacterium]|nr:hypothetical protein [Candidatus Dependentiae bacterium]
MVLRLNTNNCIFLAFFFIVCAALQLAAQDIQLSLLPSADEHFAALDEHFKKPLQVKKIVFDIDTYSNTQELLSLTGLAENSVISCQDLKRACWHLKRKNKFDTLILSLSEPTNTVDGVT